MVDLVLEPGIRDDARAALADTFEAEVLEARGLVAERGPGSGLTFVVRSEASQATDADVRAVEAWARDHRAIVRAQVGQIVDLSDHSPFTPP
jgi:hypothetical protein